MNYKIDGDKITFAVNCNLYNRDTILKVVYQFIDHYYVYLDYSREQPEYMQVELSPKKEFQAKTEEAAGEFLNELLNQNLREVIEKKTKSVRELVLARALYTSYLDVGEESLEEADEENYNINSIAKDWFNGTKGL